MKYSNYELLNGTETRRYTFDDVNAKHEKIIVDVMKIVTDPTDKHGTAYHWRKAGLTKRIITNYWSVQTYVYDTDGNCHGAYNPTYRPRDTWPHSWVLDFDWIIPATDENRDKLLDEIIRRATLDDDAQGAALQEARA